MHTRSSACPPAVAIGNRACNGDFRTQSRQHVAQRGAAGVSPPWVRRPRMQGKSRIANRRELAQRQERRMSARRGDRESRLQKRYRNRSGDCQRCSDERRCRCVTPTTVGLRAPLLSRAFAHRRNSDFYDAETHTHQERRVSARRGAITRMQRRSPAHRRQSLEQSRKRARTRVPRPTVGLRPPLFGPAARVCTP